MPIVQTDLPTTSQRCTETVLALAQRYPFLRTEILTTSAFGRPIYALTLGQGERKVLYSAAHHANEWITTPVLLKFVEELADAWETGGTLFGVPAETILNAATIHTVPMVDPDGVDLVTGAIDSGTLEYETARSIAESFPAIPFPSGWKANLLGVDLNLQYPAGWLQAREIKFSQGFDRPAPRDYVGRAPLNQLESRALAEYTHSVDPALVLAYHSQGQVIYWQFRDIFVPGARELGEEFARLSGYVLEDTPFESAFAGYKDWFIQEFRRPGYTIEVGLGESPLPLSQFDEIYRDNLGILVTAATGLPNL
jgi:g-D-glutamyl-meso-diaminopimelate peptidase